jgi:tripartite-type tricarboxylate transporter receptor subunit TctC
MTFTIVVAAACAAASLTAAAQTTPAFPVKPIRIVVPSSAGGTQDTLARLSPEEFDRMLRADIETFAKVAKAAGLIAR